MGLEGIALVALELGLGLAAMVPLKGLLSRYIFDAAQLSAPLCAAVLAILFAAALAAVGVPGPYGRRESIPSASCAESEFRRKIAVNDFT